MTVFPLPTSGLVYYADPSPLRGSDIKGDGSAKAPFLTIRRAIEAVRAKRAGPAAATPATIVLREGASVARI